MKSLYGELVQIDIANCVNNMVEAMLPRFTKDKVLIITIRMEAENFTLNHRIGKNFSLVFYRSSNYTFVGTRIPVDGENPMYNFPDRIENELKRHSYHDSCWRSDGTKHVIHKMAQEIVSKCKNDGKDYSVYTHFGEINLVDANVDVQDYDSNKNSKYIPILKN
jgi:hypothetical protein